MSILARYACLLVVLALGACDRDDEAAPAEPPLRAGLIELEVATFSEQPTLEAYVLPGQLTWAGYRTSDSLRGAAFAASRAADGAWEVQRYASEGSDRTDLRYLADGVLVAQGFDAGTGERLLHFGAGGSRRALSIDAERYRGIAAGRATAHGLLYWSRVDGERRLSWLPTGASTEVDLLTLPEDLARDLQGVTADATTVYGVYRRQAYTPATVTYVPFRFEVADPIGSYREGDPYAARGAIAGQWNAPGVIGDGVYTLVEEHDRGLLRWTLPDLRGGVLEEVDGWAGAPRVDDHVSTVTYPDGRGRAFAEIEGGWRGSPVYELRPDGLRALTGGRLDFVLPESDSVLSNATAYRAEHFFRVFHAEAELVYLHNAYFVIAVDAATGETVAAWATAPTAQALRERGHYLTDARASDDSIYVAGVSSYGESGVDLLYAAFAK